MWPCPHCYIATCCPTEKIFVPSCLKIPLSMTNVIFDLSVLHCTLTTDMFFCAIYSLIKVNICAKKNLNQKLIYSPEKPEKQSVNHLSLTLTYEPGSCAQHALRQTFVLSDLNIPRPVTNRQSGDCMPISTGNFLGAYKGKYVHMYIKSNTFGENPWPHKRLDWLVEMAFTTSVK